VEQRPLKKGEIAKREKKAGNEEKEKSGVTLRKKLAVLGLSLKQRGGGGEEGKTLKDQ